MHAYTKSTLVEPPLKKMWHYHKTSRLSFHPQQSKTKNEYLLRFHQHMQTFHLLCHMHRNLKTCSTENDTSFVICPQDLKYPNQETLYAIFLGFTMTNLHKDTSSMKLNYCNMTKEQLSLMKMITIRWERDCAHAFLQFSMSVGLRHEEPKKVTFYSGFLTTSWSLKKIFFDLVKKPLPPPLSPHSPLSEKSQLARFWPGI